MKHSLLREYCVRWVYRLKFPTSEWPGNEFVTSGNVCALQQKFRKWTIWSIPLLTDACRWPRPCPSTWLRPQALLSSSTKFQSDIRECRAYRRLRVNTFRLLRRIWVRTTYDIPIDRETDVRPPSSASNSPQRNVNWSLFPAFSLLCWIPIYEAEFRASDLQGERDTTFEVLKHWSKGSVMSMRVTLATSRHEH